MGSCLPLAVLALLCLAQVYTYRLRRAIAAFYFPKVSSSPGASRGPGTAQPGPGGRFLGWAGAPRHPSRSLPVQREKSRVLYLYNKLLRQRQSFVRRQRKRIAQRAQQHPGLVSGDRDTGLGPHRGAGVGGFSVPRSQVCFPVGRPLSPSPTRPRPCRRGRRCWSGAAGAGRACAAGCVGAARCAGRPRPPGTGFVPHPPAEPRTVGRAGGRRAARASPAPLGTAASPRTAARRTRGTRPEGARQ